MRMNEMVTYEIRLPQMTDHMRSDCRPNELIRDFMRSYEIGSNKIRSDDNKRHQMTSKHT